MNRKQKIILLTMVVMVMSLFGCGKKSYNVDYCGQKNMFSGAEDSYMEGDTVELSYELIATDTDYTFFVDGQAVNAKWNVKKGYIIKFTMPDHDIEVYCTQRNSMMNPNE